MLFAQWFFILALVLTAIAAWTDWREGIIPNWLSLGVLALAPVLHSVVHFKVAGPLAALEALLLSVLGALVCGAIPLLLYVTGGGRGGDVKLLAALGAVCLWGIGIEAVFYSFIAASVLAGIQLAYRGKLLQTLTNSLLLVVNPILPKAKRRPLSRESMTWVKLGPAVLIGTIVALFLNWRIA